MWINRDVSIQPISECAAAFLWGGGKFAANGIWHEDCCPGVLYTAVTGPDGALGAGDNRLNEAETFAIRFFVYILTEGESAEERKKSTDRLKEMHQ